MSLFNKKPKKGSQDQIVISAPLGDVRHVSHIGRDGADFGEEHLFQSKSRHNSGPKFQKHKQTYVNQHDSPIIKSAIPLHQAASIIKLDHKTESHDSGNFDQNLGENGSCDSSGNRLTSNTNSNNNNVTVISGTANSLGSSVPANIPLGNGLSVADDRTDTVSDTASGSLIPVLAGRNTRESLHVNYPNAPGAPGIARSKQQLNQSKSIPTSTLVTGSSSHHVAHSSSHRSQGSGRTNGTAPPNLPSSNGAPRAAERYFSKHSLDSLSLDTVGSLNGIERSVNAEKEESTSLLGDVLAVMDLDKFATVPGVRGKVVGKDAGVSKSEVTTTSMEELNSSQFTTRSEEGLMQENSNMEVISENSREFEVGDMVISTNNSNPDSGSFRQPHARLKQPVTATKSLDLYTNQPQYGGHQSLSGQHSSASAIRSMAVRNQSFKGSQKQLITEPSQVSTASREPSVKLHPLKVESGSDISTDEIAL